MNIGAVTVDASESSSPVSALDPARNGATGKKANFADMTARFAVAAPTVTALITYVVSASELERILF